MTLSNYSYLLVNLACFIVPFVFSFHPALRFSRNHKYFLIGAVAMMLVFIPWDVYFTGEGVWGFNEKYLLGLNFANLPLEECLFFLCIPYACIFTYHCITIWFKDKPIPRWPTVVAWIFFCFCISMAIVFYDKLYTVFTHLACATLLFFHLVIWKNAYLRIFVISFLLILLPFILSNGILTGIEFWKYPLVNSHPELITEKIVWYNNNETIGTRLFSIPLEDVSYGMAMLLLATTVYEYSRKRQQKNKYSSAL